ncbi:hypothetical protein LAZ67_3005236 [Cordylochernes scorpioides]|uniref:Reverse transcriptase domain-containing protein n=1 Tax=Cordylochernes scorpioides TaxID=51811 RepID=A0ABY6KA59_9ARAC|nr:hypothetical protein LAZ67_3005236 [Cordylochernes scorpioides]
MEIAEKQKIQIIALQETKLNEKYNLKYKNYNILRKDRNKEGGGLAFLIKNLYYENIAINIPNTSDLEAQGIKVYLSQNKTINIFNMYHPPNNKLIDDGTMAQFLTDNTIIVGDLNAKHQLWGCSMPNPRGKILSNIFDDNAFMCLNDGNPTHHSYSYNTAQALDISFSSPDIFHKCKWQILKIIGSDHLPILIEISTKTKTSSIKEKFWNFKKANWNLYQKNTNEDFRKAPTRIKDLEQNWISFKNTIIKAAKVSIPRGNIKKWIPNYTHQAKDIQTLITKRNELQKKCTQNQTNCRTELNIVNAKIKRLYIKLKKRPERLFMTKNFTSTHNIFHEKINMKELDYALENTDLNKTPGPDGIHGQMISNLGKNGKEILLDIFNNSWKTGKLPQDWKTATIIPIKKLDKSADDPKNYRPISLTSICCKLMEKIILRRLTYHLDTRNLLPEEQYGFRKGHGTIDQLLFFTQKVEKMCNISTNCSLRQFDMESYPSHVSNLKFYAYRPIIIQEVLNRYGVVFWLDLQLEVTSNQLEELLPEAAKHGLVSWSIHQPTSALTHPGMFDFFHTRQDLFYFHRMVDPAHLGIFNLERIHHKLMRPWVHCALTAHCIAPIGAQALGCRFDKKPLFRYSGCHHYDMSALNVLLGLLTDFNQGPFTARDQDKFFLPQGRQDLPLNSTDSAAPALEP